MKGQHKKYFTFFGVLAATVDKQLLSMQSLINTLNNNTLPKIVSILLANVLKPVNQYSTNNI